MVLKAADANLRPLQIAHDADFAAASLGRRAQYLSPTPVVDGIAM